MMVDLLAEYFAALCDTQQKTLRQLIYAGATERAIAIAAPALAKVRLCGRGLFEPDPDSPNTAFLVPVRVENPVTPETVDIYRTLTDGEIVDLVAFTPGLQVRWAVRTGEAEWLGACDPQYLEPPPVRIHRAPLDWLRADCDGVVCLATDPPTIHHFLCRFHAISVDDDRYAEELREVLLRPPSVPEILVGGRAFHAW